MVRYSIALLGLTAAISANATTYGAGDYGGASLIMASGDRITGTLTNVGWFYVPSGVTVSSVAGTPVEIYADIADIYGTVDLVGRGEAQGLAVVGGSGNAGLGIGGGDGGFVGPCVHGGGGGGGGHGGIGGIGGYAFNGSVANGGPTYGTGSSPIFPLDLGSGGGAGGGSCANAGGAGGAGGGAFLLQASSIWFSSGTLIDADGASGSAGFTDSGGGGGGAGGSVVLIANNFVGTGVIRVSGGDGGPAGDITGLSAGGGGGGGGRIKLIYADFPSVIAYTSGGSPGAMSTSNSIQSDGGGFGSIRYVYEDLDNDGITDVLDNCASDSNNSQFDADADGLGDVCDPCPFVANEEDIDGDGWFSCDDCNDFDSSIYPGAPEYISSGGDQDCDGLEACWIDDDQDGFGGINFGFTANTSCSGASYSLTSDDCDDFDANVYPGQLEYCDGIDNNCDNLTDDSTAVDQTLWYRDLDLDGYGDPLDSTLACDPNTSQVGNQDDCDDSNPAVNPDADEYCNYNDDNCNGIEDDNAVDALVYYTDSDLDGFGAGDPVFDCWGGPGLSGTDDDCDDNTMDAYPGAQEVCDDIDNDCDMLTDDADDSLDTSTTQTFYEDLDSDGYGSDVVVEACSQPEQTSVDSGDCDDSDDSINPGAEEIEDDGIDGDCDGDSDNDGVSDADEEASGMDPHSSDSDGDGVPDGADPAPTDPGGKPEQQDKPMDPEYGFGCSTAPAPTGFAWLMTGFLGLLVRRRR